MSYVKVRSWHIEVEGNQLRTLCGLRVRARGPEAGEHQAQGWAETLPMGEPSCESCFRLQARRMEAT